MATTCLPYSNVIGVRRMREREWMKLRGRGEKSNRER